MPPDATSGSTADTDSLLRPVAVRGERVYVIDEEGNRYLDAAGSGGVVTIGHGVRSVADAVAPRCASCRSSTAVSSTRRRASS
ncbi:MAG TPA: hypothetical protein QF650_05205 [Vicinamibacterales bacterium]|jgi:adenosylmethionine-8-amino-7-oxononanoate aminotransferase|nr:hypothetical protein [Acidobacteriota bacterium]HJO37983.1 hypothetical protein [Vicinamibacterales bacterium]